MNSNPKPTPEEERAAKIKSWRDRAEEYRNWSETYREPTTKKLLRDMAEVYDRMADHLEKKSFP